MLASPFLIGIAGGTGSGKTTVAAALAADLGPGRATAIDADCYYRDLSHLPLPERHHINFDHPDALDNELLIEHVRLLKHGEAAARRPYDYCTHTRAGGEILIAPAPVVIVEGVLIFVPAKLRLLFDLKVFLDEAADVRLLRRIGRDMAERGRTLESIRRQYLEQVRPMHEAYVEPSKRYADIIIGPGADCGDAVARIRASLREKGLPLEGA